MRVSVSIAAACIVVAASQGCSRSPSSPQPEYLDPVSLQVYRAVAESIYVKSTNRPVVIASSPLDTACRLPTCAALERRWALETPAWWDSTESAEVTTVRRDILEKAGSPARLGLVAIGRPMLMSVPDDAIPGAQADTAEWVSFRRNHGEVAGVLRFSPVGVSASGSNAMVVALWRCGPWCGHSVSVHLRRVRDSVWSIGGVILTSRLSAAGADSTS